MATTETMPRQFNAPSGLEIMKAILTDVENQLKADFHFSNHLSYPLVNWRFRIALDCYPREVGKFAVEGGGSLRDKNARTIEPDEVPEEVNIEGGRDVSAPGEGQTADAMRRETGQPLHRVTHVKGPEGSRIAVEAPQVPVEGRESQQTSEEPRVNKKPGFLGRFVDLKTRANPKGTPPVIATGSAPTEADAEEIIRRGLEEGTLEPGK